MQPQKLMGEMKDRHLYRVAVIYAAAAWLLLQVGDIVAESFSWPAWLMQGLILIAFLGFPFTLLVFWFVGAPTSGKTTAPARVESANEKPSLIVLPFDCFSDLPDDLWATNALTEDLTALIARNPGYSVVARNTAFTYRDKSVDVRELHRDLGLRYVLEGSVRRTPEALRVTAQLIDAETGAHLWAEKYDQSAEEFDQLHDELCQAICLKLGNELTRAEMNFSRRKPPSQWSAWDLYQQARGALQFTGWSRESFAKVADLLKQAIELDPDFAPAHAYLALILALGHWARLYPNREETFNASIESGRRAMELEPESSEVLGYVGCALSDLGEPEKGIPIIERAIELNPSNSQAFAALGAAKVVSGRVEEGISELRHALRISPADPGLAPWSTILSIALSHTGQVNEALEAADRACKADPRYFGGYLALAMARWHAGQPDEAQRALEEARELNPDLSNEAAASLVGKKAWAALRESGFGAPNHT
jgi:adenylate cyclase